MLEKRLGKNSFGKTDPGKESVLEKPIFLHRGGRGITGLGENRFCKNRVWKTHFRPDDIWPIGFLFGTPMVWPGRSALVDH